MVGAQRQQQDSNQKQNPTSPLKSIVFRDYRHEFFENVMFKGPFLILLVNLVNLSCNFLPFPVDQ
jgi:hypothetical protein